MTLRKSENIAGVMKELIGVEEDTYEAAKETARYRNELRANLREMLENRTHLSADSEFYAGILRTPGRVNWKSVSEELAEKGNVQDSDYNATVEKYRKPGQKLKYGKRDDKKAMRRLGQMEFVFLTPQGIADFC